jgi:hypothetical protein
MTGSKQCSKPTSDAITVWRSALLQRDGVRDINLAGAALRALRKRGGDAEKSGVAYVAAFDALFEALQSLDMPLTSRVALLEMLASVNNHQLDWTNAVGHVVRLAVSFMEESERLANRTRARRAGRAKAALDPKKVAIDASRELWRERESGKHPKLRTEDQFAMEVARRWPIICSITAIKKRSTKWRKEAKIERAAGK